MTVKAQGLSSKSQSVERLFLMNIRLFDPCHKKKQWADSGIQRLKRLISRVKKCITTEVNQPKPKPKPKGNTKVTEGWTLRSQDEAVIETQKMFPGVIGDEDEIPETDVIK